MFLRYQLSSLGVACLATMSFTEAIAGNGESFSALGRLNDELARYGAAVMIVPRNNGRTVTRLIWEPTLLNVSDIKKRRDDFPSLSAFKITEVEFRARAIPPCLEKELRQIQCHVKRVIIRANDARDSDVRRLTLLVGDRCHELTLEGKQFSPRCLDDLAPSLRVVVLLSSSREQSRKFLGYTGRGSNHRSLVVLARPNKKELTPKTPGSDQSDGAEKGKREGELP